MLGCILLSMAGLYLSPANQHKKPNSGINKGSKWISYESSDMDHLTYALIMPPLFQMDTEACNSWYNEWIDIHVYPRHIYLS